MVSPHSTNSTYSLIHPDLIFSTLTRQDQAGNIVPGLADSWKMSEDGMSYTFVLNANAKWHDGEPVTAKDVAFSLTCLADPRTSSIYTSRYNSVTGIDAFRDGSAESVEGFEVVDDLTFKISLDEPVAEAVMLGQLGAPAPIFPMHILGEVKPEEFASHPFWQTPTVGCGPFKFNNYQTDQYMELDRYDDYHLGAASFPKLILRIGDQNVLQVQLSSGEVDIAAVPPLDVSAIENDASIEIHRYASTVAQSLYVNLSNELLQDIRVRQAMSYALDRAMIASIAQGDPGLVCFGPVAAPEWAVSPNITTYEYDPDHARALLEEAGWDSSVKLNYRYPTGNAGREKMGPLVQAAFKDIGIEIDLQLTDFATLQSDAAEGAFDLLSLGNQNAYDPSSLALQYISTAIPPDGVNYGFYANERVDEIFDLAQSGLDQDARAALYHEFQDIVTQELPRVWVMVDPEVVASRTRISGIDPSPSWGLLRSIYWNITQWTVTD